MAKRNSQEAKRAARERLRVEREKQAKRDKIRRQAIVGGSLVAVLAIAGGVAYYAARPNGPWDAASRTPTRAWHLDGLRRKGERQKIVCMKPGEKTKRKKAPSPSAPFKT